MDIKMMDWLPGWKDVPDLIWLMFLLMMLMYFLHKRYEHNQGIHWLVTKGKITRFFLADGSSWPKIEYSYVLYDQVFFGEHFFLDAEHHSIHSSHARQLAYRVAKAFRADEDIDIYYNPDNPSQAVLDISVSPRLNGIIVLMGLLAAFQLAMMARKYF